MILFVTTYSPSQILVALWWAYWGILVCSTAISIDNVSTTLPAHMAVVKSAVPPYFVIVGNKICQQETHKAVVLTPAIVDILVLK